ncbi:MAG TPA: glycine cleavage system protein GcvH [Aggregatilineales bacterium]|nr:glycine cleavage system protein GcvH [Aggregatilineales bacterium]
MGQTKVVDGLKYTRSDEWIKVEGDEAVVGVTDYAQSALSDIVFVELPDLGATFKANDTFGTVESVKAASDMHTPASGTITAVNKLLETKPETVNSDPYGAGWFVKLKLSAPAELDALLDAAAYAKYCDERE